MITLGVLFSSKPYQCSKYYNKEINENTVLAILTSICNTYGGIIKICNKTIDKINGFPNNIWGWGVEDKALKNRVLRYCNEQGVQMLHNKKAGGMYLKSVFYLPKNYEVALKLMYILWYPGFSGQWYSIAIGILLGYKDSNIIHFTKKNYDMDIKKKDINHIRDIIRKMDITLEDLQKKQKIIHMDTIPLL